MPAQIAILHGWSDTSASFTDLKTFLQTNGYRTTQIWLGDYLSLDDDVRVEDVAKRMQIVVQELITDKKLTVPFDLIVHSTGGLVAREWIATCYPDGRGCPVKRLVMLAPANFGSRLAAMGKSMIGRLAKGWNNWLQSGEQMLKALELASPYQWKLARRDLLDPTGSGAVGPYGRGKVWPFVIVGSRPYASGLRTIVNEDGSDGTVRVSAANLNAAGMTVDFATDPDKPAVAVWSSRVAATQIPCAVIPDRDHGLVTKPETSGKTDLETAKRLGQLILQALACNSDADYEKVGEAWRAVSDATAGLANDKARLEATFQAPRPDPGTFHQYMQFFVYARDDHGQPVNDFFLEFFAPETRGDQDAVYFHAEVLEHVHTNSVVPSHRCLYMDRTDLLENFYRHVIKPEKKKLAVSVSAAAIGPNVRYFDKTREGARGHIIMHEQNEARRDELDARLHRNCTHLVELILPRQPIDKVFRLS